MDDHGGLEVTLPLRHRTLRGLSWGHPESHWRLLAWHGWLDNAAAFIPLAPRLAQQGCHVLALDLPGHGASDHKPPGEVYHMVENLLLFDEVLDHLAWPETVLLGHSLGGVLSLLYASAAPERLQRLVVLDALGPMASESERTAENFTRALQKQRAASNPKRVYDSIEAAAQDRTQGFGGLSLESSRRLVERNLEPCATGWQWRTDARLRWPSLLRMSEEQVQACLQSVRTPLQLIFADRGFFPTPESRQPRLSCLPEARVDLVAGPHHLHMDGDVEGLASVILEFLKEGKS